VYTVVLFVYCRQIALAALISAPITLAIAVLFSRRLSVSYHATFSSNIEQEAMLADFIKGAGTVKTLNAEVVARWILEGQLAKTTRLRRDFMRLSASVQSGVGFYHELLRLALIGIAVYMGFKGALSPGKVVSVSLLINFMIDPFYRLAYYWGEVQEFKGVTSRLNDVFLAQSESQAPQAPSTSVDQSLRGEIEFKDVWFRYGGESSEWALKGVSFRISAGSKVVLMGSSGCGKSTILHLLTRLYVPCRGSILIDGIDYLQYDLHWLRSQIGFMHQEPKLFFGTVAENISFGSYDLDHGRIAECARIAGIHETIMGWRNGYDRRIGQSGDGLSLGERQRIALARTLYKNPPLLAMDEMTSALDGISETLFLERFAQCAESRTVVTAAHRHSVMFASERVIVMEKGQIIGQGRHEELVNSKCELYLQLTRSFSKNGKAAS
jgi:ABC-type bacteriocin/lantibiotic exporter with double-glycine peptidase domain